MTLLATQVYRVDGDNALLDCVVAVMVTVVVVTVVVGVPPLVVVAGVELEVVFCAVALVVVMFGVLVKLGVSVTLDIPKEGVDDEFEMVEGTVVLPVSTMPGGSVKVDPVPPGLVVPSDPPLADVEEAYPGVIPLTSNVISSAESDKILMLMPVDCISPPW
jgi:hypothetical protein